jgi:release factor glutamine methyltransferase
MKSREWYERIRRELSEIYPQQEAGAMADILLEEYFGIDRRRRLLEPQARIVPEAAFEQALRQLKSYRPLQYVLGRTDFGDCTLALDERVLIPRPETEELVRRIEKAYRGRTPAILDIGTGSGAIAVALARALPGSRVTGLDISQDALDVARGNARTNGVAVDFQQMDILTDCPADRRYGVIVSNPPYVRQSERTAMRPNVLDHEPAVALFVPDDDPLVFYRAIAGYARRALDPGGTLWLEINEAFGPQLVALLEEREFREVELFQDMYDKDRMIRALWR